MVLEITNALNKVCNCFFDVLIVGINKKNRINDSIFSKDFILKKRLQLYRSETIENRKIKGKNNSPKGLLNLISLYFNKLNKTKAYKAILLKIIGKGSVNITATKL